MKTKESQDKRHLLFTLSTISKSSNKLNKLFIYILWRYNHSWNFHILKEKMLKKNLRKMFTKILEFCSHRIKYQVPDAKHIPTTTTS